MAMNYEEYLKSAKSLTIETMQYIHLQMISEIANDADGQELYDELIESAVKYSSYRAKWFVWTREERIAQDRVRSACHDTFMIHLNSLSRYLKNQGKTAALRDELGYLEDDTYNRKTIGDFACYLVFVYSLNAR